MANYTSYIIDSNVTIGTITSPSAINISSTDFVTAQGRMPVYRGLVGGQYVYSVGSQPVGATDIVIVGYSSS